jgi:hypothetical protein
MLTGNCNIARVEAGEQSLKGRKEDAKEIANREIERIVCDPHFSIFYELFQRV